jgi:hypothetical protein
VRNFYTSVVELRQPFRHEVTTEPYECGWAGEAVFFVSAEDTGADFASLQLRVRISPDGVRWTDEGTVLPTLTGPGMVAGKVGHFGGWLSLAGQIVGGAGTAVLTVRLALKE